MVKVWLCALAAVFVLQPLIGQAPEIRQCNVYNMTFHEILRHSPAPAADLAALGLPASYLRLAGTHWFSPGVPKDDPAFWREVMARISYRKVLAFYAAHPAQFAALVARDASLAFVLTHNYIGHYPASAGLPPLAHSDTFNAWSAAKEAAPAKPWLLGLFVLAQLAALYRLRRRCAWPLLAALLAATALEFLAVILGDGGGEIAKHMLLVSALGDVMLVLGIGVASCELRVDS